MGGGTYHTVWGHVQRLNAPSGERQGPFYFRAPSSLKYSSSIFRPPLMHVAGAVSVMAENGFHFQSLPLQPCPLVVHSLANCQSQCIHWSRPHVGSGCHALWASRPDSESLHWTQQLPEPLCCKIHSCSSITTSGCLYNWQQQLILHGTCSLRLRLSPTVGCNGRCQKWISLGLLWCILSLYQHKLSHRLVPMCCEATQSQETSVDNPSR